MAIRVVRGTATAETPTLSYDAALAAAGVHDYNLVPVSSIIPAEADLEVAGTAPDLGPAGGRLTVVQARATVPPGRAERACAGLGWVRSRSGRGLFYEGSGTDPDAVREEVEAGLAGGRRLREWDFAGADATFESACADPDLDGYATAVVLAAYGEPEPIL